MPDLSGYRFTKTHEWVLREGATATIGISDHAQEELGDVIFVELPEVGATLEPGQKFGVIESVKAASDLYVPVGGRVAAVNENLTSTPETVNRDPYGEGWMIRLDGVTEGGDIELLDESAYAALAGG